MKSPLIAVFEKKVFANVKKHPEFRSGDTIRVHYKIQEGADSAKFRIQLYEGVVTRFKKGTANSTFTVRKISAGGIGVERVFPLFSSMVDKVEVLAQGEVRRSRLYYLRDLSGKSARIRSRYVAGSAAE
ncbi:MAG: 50S ribosomal protein L19 [Proteobacteria bacterium]|nr:50S ribosomal protein L19 [Pseudomonadota bacterium]